MVLVPDDDFAIHEVLGSVTWHTVHIQPLKLLNIWLHYLWPCLTVVQVDAVNAVLLGVLHDFINEQLPCFQLPVVEHCCIFKLLCLTISSVANMPPAILIQVMQE